jgi:sigma-B regulation protein RsbU (phosphoserine phosphatase)
MRNAMSDSGDLFAIFDAMVDGVLVFDADGTCISANSTARRMLGWDPAASTLDEIGPAVKLRRPGGARIPREELPAMRALAGLTVTDQALEFENEAHEVWSVLTSCAPFMRNDTVAGAVVSFHDVTSLEEATAQLRVSERLSRSLLRISDLVNSTHEVDEIMQRIISETCDAVGAETAAIVMRENGVWSTRYSYRFPGDIIGVILTDEDAPHAAMALATAAPVAINDAYEDPRINRAVMEGYGIRSVLTMPLISQGSVIGVMFMNHHTRPVAFSTAQIDFAANVASSISLALQNAHLYENERRVADTLQRAMLVLPESLPGIEFGTLYRSATESARVGGDFYDLFELAGGRIGVLIGDVSGKGLEAATATSAAKATVRAYALAGDEPADVLRKTNSVMRGALGTADFVTIHFGQLDPVTGDYLYSSGGHPPAILLRQDGSSTSLGCGGTILGPFLDSRYDQERVVLGTGDTLLLYTDGLTEARRGSDLYGEERVHGALRSAVGLTPQRVVEQVFFDAVDFADGRLSDDLALLAVRVQS